MRKEALTVRDYLELAVERRPLSDSVSQGYSGARLERLLLRDGRSVILKSSSASHDLAMRATRDPGRAALLFSQGVYARFPDVIDTTVLAAESSDEGVQLVMRDVAGTLVADEQRLSRAVRAPHGRGHFPWGCCPHHLSKLRRSSAAWKRAVRRVGGSGSS